MRFKLSAAAVIGLLGLYAAFWVYMANNLETNLHQFAKDEAAKGNEVHWETLTVSGFPARMSAEMTGFAYVQNVNSPKMRFVMTETLKAHVLPYKLNHIIVEFPEPVIIDRHDPADESMRLQTALGFDEASMSIVETDRGPRIAFEGTGATIVGTPYGPMSASMLYLFMRPGQDARQIDIALQADDLVTDQTMGKPYSIKSKAVVEQGEVLFQGLTLKDWAEVGGEIHDLDMTLTAQDFSITANGVAGLSDQGVLRAKMDVTVDRTDAFLDELGRHQNWSNENRSLIGSLIAMTDLSDGSPDQRVKVPLVADEKAVMAGPFKLDDPIIVGDSLGF